MTIEIRDLPVNQIRAGSNDRKDFDQVELQDLADSIANYGLAQPITVRQVDGMYEIIAGERRFRAVSQVLKRETIPAIVKELDDEAASAVMLAENTSRADLNPIEEANAYQSRITRFNWSVERIASVAGVSKDRVKSRLTLLKLSEQSQWLVKVGQFPVGHAVAMTVLDHNRQAIAVRVYGQGKAMSLAAFKSMVADLQGQESQERLFDIEHFWSVQTVSERYVASGKAAQVDVPKAPHLPKPEVRATDTTSSVIWRYIQVLAKSGYENEAGAIGSLFETLVKTNCCSIPRMAS